MGLFRKLTSLSTMGLVDYRTRDERALRYAKQTRNAARMGVIQNGRLRATIQDEFTVLAGVIEDKPVSPPAWHPDPLGIKRLRWWDGTKWTDHTAD